MDYDRNNLENSTLGMCYHQYLPDRTVVLYFAGDFTSAEDHQMCRDSDLIGVYAWDDPRVANTQVRFIFDVREEGSGEKGTVKLYASLCRKKPYFEKIRFAVDAKMSMLTGMPEQTHDVAATPVDQPVILDLDEKYAAVLSLEVPQFDFVGGDGAASHLFVRCDVKFCHFLTEDGIVCDAKPNNIWRNYVKQLTTATQLPFLSDFKLISSSGQSFPTYRLVLSARSPVFKAMFSSDTKENQQGFCTVPDVDSETMDTFLKFLHSCDISQVASVAQKLIVVAERYDIQDLKELCLHKLNEAVTGQNAADMLILADTLLLKSLKSMLFCKIRKWGGVFLRSGGLEMVKEHSVVLHEEVAREIDRIFDQHPET